jgi:hypothetical protein
MARSGVDGIGRLADDLPPSVVLRARVVPRIRHIVNPAIEK